MVLKDCFYVGASLYRLCESEIFGVRASFGVDACRVFPQSALAIIFLIGVCVQYCGDQSLHWMLSMAPLGSVVVKTLLGTMSALQLLE